MTTIIGTFPTTISNGQVEDATVVMQLFSFIQSQTNTNGCPATTGSTMLKGDGSGGTTAAIPGTDYALPGGGGGANGISVTNYPGNDPTGATDSLGAFNLAQAAATGNGQVIVPPGTWKLSANTNPCTWIIDANATFTGSGSLVGKVARLAGGLGTVAGAQFGSTSNYAEVLRTYSQSISNFSSLSSEGQIGLLGASQSSDSGTGGSLGCIGIEALANNNNTTQIQTAFAGYFEVTRQSGAGTCIGFEIDPINRGSVVHVQTNAVLPTGFTAGGWIASGGGYSGVNPVSLALGILYNGSTFDKGIVFFDGAITTVGSQAVAIALGYEHALVWYFSGTQMCSINSTASAASMNLLFQNTGIAFNNLSGSQIWGFDYNGNLAVGGGTGTFSIYAGALNFSGLPTPTSASGGAASALPSLPLGYLEVQLSGTNVKIPFYNV